MQSRLLHIGKGKLALLKPYNRPLTRPSSNCHTLQHEHECSPHQIPTCLLRQNISSVTSSARERSYGTIYPVSPGRYDTDGLSPDDRHSVEGKIVSWSDDATKLSTFDPLPNTPNSVVRRTLSLQGYKAAKSFTCSVLSAYLDIENAIERQVLARQVPIGINSSRLPTILLAYMHIESVEEELDADHAVKEYLSSHQTYLQQRGYDRDDLARWARILSGENADQQCERLFAQHKEVPRFILLEILRHDIRHVSTLHKVFVYLLSDEKDALHDFDNRKDVRKGAMDWARSDDQIFNTLLTRLLRQVRNIWPAAVSSIVSLVERRLEWMRDSPCVDSKKARLVDRVTKLVNRTLTLLSVPSKLNPLSNMRHVWKGQRRLLETASSFNPPLLLSQNSYRAVVSTLIGSKKSDLEMKSATLRTRSWPPWRQDQDGMDARRSMDEDVSRVLSALAKMQEAGYRTSASDEAARIYGGMESDGTPTIQTRRVWRRLRPGTRDLEMAPLTWAARIEATRDVQEAWGAFLEYKERGGVPSQAMFFAMYQKIDSHNMRLSSASRGVFSPGDGREVLSLSNDSFTKYYIERHQPPPLQILYAEMLHTGIRPSGRCLAFLVSKARTSDEGVGYLLDSEIDQSVIERLRDPSLNVGVEKFTAVPDMIFCAYIELICRLAPRSITDPRHRIMSTSDIDKSVNTTSSDVSDENVREQRQRKGRHALSRETFSHVSYLLRSSSTKHRPSWYAYFRALAREGAIIPRAVVGGRTSKWDSVTWSRIVGVLKGFHAAGLELDPQGFLHLCVGFEKFAADPLIKDVPLRQLGPVHTTDRMEVFINGVELLKHEFSKLSYVKSIPNNIPAHLHTIRGVHLHAYIRALGAVADHIAILDVLKWMVKHNEELELISADTRNGFSSFRKTLTAACYLLQSTDYADDAQIQVEQVEWWGSWPVKDEVRAYIINGTSDGQVVEGPNEEERDTFMDSQPWSERPI